MARSINDLKKTKLNLLNKIWTAQNARITILNRIKEKYEYELKAIYDFINGKIDEAVKEGRFNVNVNTYEISSKFNCFKNETLVKILYELIKQELTSRGFSVEGTPSYYGHSLIKIKW